MNTTNSLLPAEVQNDSATLHIAIRDLYDVDVYQLFSTVYIVISSPCSSEVFYASRDFEAYAEYNENDLLNVAKLQKQIDAFLELIVDYAYSTEKLMREEFQFSRDELRKMLVPNYIAYYRDDHDLDNLFDNICSFLK